MHKDDHDDITAIAFLQHTTVVLDLVFISFTCFTMYFVTSRFRITRFSMLVMQRICLDKFKILSSQ